MAKPKMNSNDFAVLQVGMEGKKEVFEMSPNRTLFSALNQFCEKLGWDVRHHCAH